MGIKYKSVKWVFNGVLFAEFCKRAIDNYGVEPAAHAIGVHPSTLIGWSEQRWREKFPHPAMGNFINACNLMDADPRLFWELD